jgi:hypothetical protein
MIQMHVGRRAAEKDQPEGKQAGEHHAHHRVLLDPAVLFDETGAYRAKQPRTEGTERKRQPDNVGDDDSRKHRV